MIQIYVNNTFLDLPADLRLSFKKKNNIFNFSGLEFERTLNFSIRATKKNNDTFGRANDGKTYGELARRKISAKIFMDSIVADGLLYINSCDSEVYDCVFLFGEFFALKALSNVGDVSNEITLYSSDSCNLQNLTTGGIGTKPYLMASYKNSAGGVKFPTVNLYNLFGRNQRGITFNFDNVDSVTEYNIKMLSLVQCTAKQRSTDNVNINTFEYNYDYHGHTIKRNQNNISSTYAYAMFERGIFMEFRWERSGTTYYKKCEVLAFNQDTELTFPVSFGSQYHVIEVTGMSFQMLDLNFVGGYSFNKSTSAPSGVPLAGRTIDIEARDGDGKQRLYAIVDRNEWQYTENNGYGDYAVVTGGFENGTAIGNFTGFSIKMEEDMDLLNGSTCYLRDNLPKMTYIDIINTLRLASNSYVKLHNNVLYFYNFNCSTWNIKKIEKITNTGRVERLFSDFAQRNYVKFDTDDNVKNPLVRTYIIDNANMENEKDIIKYKGSEGLMDYDGRLYINDIVITDDGYDVNASKMTFGVARDNTQYGITTTLLDYAPNSMFTYSDELQRICNASTQMQIEVLMSEHDYMLLQEDILLFFDGALWVWTECAYTDGKATLTINKYVKNE